MREDITEVGSESTGPMGKVLESWLRERAQELIQRILEEEVTELLGRGKSGRKRVLDEAAGYHGKLLLLVMSLGTIAVRRPRVRTLEERWRRDSTTGGRAAERPPPLLERRPIPLPRTISWTSYNLI